MAEDPVSFELDIAELFTQRDQEAMLIQFDLWEVDDVRENADVILEVLTSGRMPCYGAWDEARVGLFRRWMEQGKAD